MGQALGLPGGHETVQRVSNQEDFLTILLGGLLDGIQA
jgi:hypothetical protein